LVFYTGLVLAVIVLLARIEARLGDFVGQAR
jgi:hypothetical protein